MLLFWSLKVKQSQINGHQWKHLKRLTLSLCSFFSKFWYLCFPSAFLFVYLLPISPATIYLCVILSWFLSASSLSFVSLVSPFHVNVSLPFLFNISFPYASFPPLFLLWLPLLPSSSSYFPYYHSLKTTKWKGNLFIRIDYAYHILCSIFFVS